MQESVSDFFSILDFLVPTLGETRAVFETLTRTDITVAQSAAFLRLVGHLMLRREHQHVTHEMQLPPRHQLTINLELDGFERDVYTRVAEKCAAVFCKASWLRQEHPVGRPALHR